MSGGKTFIEVGFRWYSLFAEAAVSNIPPSYSSSCDSELRLTSEFSRGAQTLANQLVEAWSD